MVGLTNTAGLQSRCSELHSSPNKAAAQSSSKASCETGYVTRRSSTATSTRESHFPYGYGGGPGCSGLTPSQTNSIYRSADMAGPRGEGAGVSLAVFELSAYQNSDIDHLGTRVLRPGLHASTGQHHRRRRAFEPDLPDR